MSDTRQCRYSQEVQTLMHATIIWRARGLVKRLLRRGKGRAQMGDSVENVESAKQKPHIVCYNAQRAWTLSPESAIGK